MRRAHEVTASTQSILEQTKNQPALSSQRCSFARATEDVEHGIQAIAIDLKGCSATAAMHLVTNTASTNAGQDTGARIVFPFRTSLEDDPFRIHVANSCAFGKVVGQTCS